MRQLEDSKIIDLFFERSEQAIDELSRKYGPAVKKTAANMRQSSPKLPKGWIPCLSS